MSSSSTTTSSPSVSSCRHISTHCAPEITSSESGGSTKSCLERAPRWSRSRQTVWRNHYDRLAAGREPRFSDTYGGNLSLPRRDFLAAGGFALDLTPEEDVEFGYRLWHAGMTFVYVAEPLPARDDRDTLERFVADVTASWCRRRDALRATPWASAASSARRCRRASRGAGSPSAVRACPSVSSTPPCARRQARAERDLRGALAVVPVQLLLQPRRSRQRRRGHLASSPAGDGDPDVPRDRPPSASRRAVGYCRRPASSASSSG